MLSIAPQKVPLPEKPCSPSTCPGIQVPDNTICPCKAEEFWNGDKCVKRHECPCVTDGDTHKAGDIYQNEDCATCTCALYGLESCVKKECPDCGAVRV